ncbi:MAG: ParB N-terminal domain-containing protein, partial [Gammaproteobacteria bacterium]|nr:ParB N-terminal domain-containing protein [Gammaproteobacteria bacterium]
PSFKSDPETLKALVNSVKVSDDVKKITETFNFAQEQAQKKAKAVTTTGSPIEQLSSRAANSIENKPTGVREGRVAEIIKDYQAGKDFDPIEVRELPDGTIDIIDGRHRLEAARLSNKKIEVKNVTKEFEAPVQKPKAPFIDEGDVSTKILGKLEGKTSVNKQFISDLTNSGDIKQSERDMIREVLSELPDGKIDVADFSDKVKTQLIPLNIKAQSGTGKSVGYESVSLSDDIRGNVENYTENIYESPIKNTAGDIHFPDETKNYFAHSRIEDMADSDIRRIIEVQSDLFQKGNLERNVRAGTADGTQKLLDIKPIAEKGVSQLQAYRNTFWERIIREEVRTAAKDGKTLQFPTGETAMKIEGLGSLGKNRFRFVEDGKNYAHNTLTPDNVKVGQELFDLQETGETFDSGKRRWLVTEVFDDGQFKAAPKRIADNHIDNWNFGLETMDGKKLPDDFKGEGAVVVARNKITNEMQFQQFSAGRKVDAEKFLRNKVGYSGDLQKQLADRAEQFDVSGKVDKKNPIFKFYEKDIAKYLKKNYNAKKVTDNKGVEWMEFKPESSLAGKPVQAFSAGVVGIETDEETGEISIDPIKAVAGMLGVGLYTRHFSGAPTKVLLKNLKKHPDYEDAAGNVIQEMDFAEAGQRGAYVHEKDGLIDKITSKRSTFPDWTSEHLRKRELFDKVVKHIEDGTEPAKAATNQKELYDETVDEIAARLT